jgi:5'(3')-deoxyribonucleotidase
MKRLPRVLLDIDGVCADFVTPVLAAAGRMMGREFVLDDVHQWDILQAIGADAEVIAAVDRVIEQPGFCASLQVYPGVHEGLKQLRQYYEVVVVTSPFTGPHWVAERDAWLRRELGFAKSDIVHTAGKRVCAGDVLIDDKDSTLVEWATYHPEGLPILFDQPWNRKDVTTRRAMGWTHLVAMVRHHLGSP